MFSWRLFHNTESESKEPTIPSDDDKDEPNPTLPDDDNDKPESDDPKQPEHTDIETEKDKGM